jgi:hypothetical protein
MVTRRSPWLAVVLLCGVLVAGCGSSSSSSTSSQAATTSSTPAKTTSVPTGTTSQVTQAAVAACRAGVAHSAVSASVKAKLETICNEAASGNAGAAREAAKKACVEIVNSSPLPAGAGKEAAIAACNRVAPPK